METLLLPFSPRFIILTICAVVTALLLGIGIMDHKTFDIVLIPIVIFGALTLLGSTQVGATGGVGAVDARLSPDGRYLFVDESRIGAVGAFAVTGGNLTELPSSPTLLPAGATPAGIVVNYSIHH